MTDDTLIDENTRSTATGPAPAPLPPRSVAVLRVALAVVFLWPVADKTFGLGYATPADRAWITGASPTEGYLAHTTGPAADVFASIAGPVTDWGFMLGMLATGVALLLGLGLRVAACSGVALMALLWLTAWPVAAGSNNPIVDEHVLVAVSVVVVAVTRAGDRWGLGRPWAASPVPGAATWMR